MLPFPQTAPERATNHASRSFSQLSLSSSLSSSHSHAEASPPLAPSSPSVAAATAAADEQLERNKTRGHRLPSIMSGARVPRVRLTEEEQARYDRALCLKWMNKSGCGILEI